MFAALIWLGSWISGAWVGVLWERRRALKRELQILANRPTVVLFPVKSPEMRQ